MGIPRFGIPKGAHMFRITPCLGNQYPVCVLAKISKGTKTLVKMWTKVLPARNKPRRRPECPRATDDRSVSAQDSMNEWRLKGDKGTYLDNYEKEWGKWRFEQQAIAKDLYK